MKLTREEILNMPAGIEMDELIAKELDMYLNLRESRIRQGDYSVYVGASVFYFHPFSTDITAAWEVVEKFYSMSLDKYSDGKEWRAYLVTGITVNIDAGASAETAPLAICRAALLTVMEGKTR